MPFLFRSRRDRFRIAIMFLAFLAAASSSICTLAADRAVVPSFERFYTGEKADAVRGGQLLLGELNCTSCHRLEKAHAAVIAPKKAPVLDRVGSRVRPEYLRAFLSNPQRTKPGATMPHLFAGVGEKQRQQQVEALVHFLALSGSIAEMAPAGTAVRKGEKLFHEIGCTACHDPQRKDSPQLATSVPLAKLSSKYSIPGLMQFIHDPLAVRASGRMPNLNLSNDEARDIASYLLKDLKVAANLKYAYFEGNWDKVPDFGKLKPKETGSAIGFDVRVGRSDNFGIRFEGIINIARDGEYTFHVGSDDGSRLLIDGKQVAIADGVHPFQFQSGKLNLTAGHHRLTVDYFEAGGDEELRVEFQGPGVNRQSAELALVSPDQDKKDDDRFVVDPALVKQGGKLFSSLGCASCHQMGDKKPEERLVEIPTLAKVNLQRDGCLAEKSSLGIPAYALNKQQRTSMKAALAALKTPLANKPSDAETLHRTLVTLNCYACHQRGEVGGVETARNAFFLGNQKEMGDEGRIPPLLTGAGGKLKASWLKQVFEQGSKERPYMFTRMPRFGPANVGHLTAALEAVDLKKPTTAAEIPFTDRKLKVAGRFLVGGKALSCIKCHTFANHKATGVQSISMTSMHRRLRKDWFLEYMLNPQAYRPGTRMPAAWPNGQTFYAKLLDGKTETQIASVWTFLSDAEKARAPLGLGGSPIEIIAETEAVIYRNFIDGAGPRAIGVGYPEQANLAFDANNMQITLLWQGAFIDAAKHWNGRGQGFQPPLGDNILKLPAAAPFAILESAAAPWPAGSVKEAGYRFRGYRLDKKRQPTFMYSLGEIAIGDFPQPIPNDDSPGLRRTLTLSSSTTQQNLFYRAAVGGKITATDDGWFTIDGDWKTRVDSPGGKPILRKSGNNMELLVPVELRGKKTTITQEFSW